MVVRVGRYGPYLQRGEDRASLPEDVAPDELTETRAEELLDAPSEDRVLGTDPETGLEVSVRAGRFGPYVQLGEVVDGQPKPRTASLFASMTPATLTFEQAARASRRIPRTVGTDPDTGEEIVAHNGRFGPYLKRGTDTRSLTAEEQILTIGLDEARAIFAQPKTRRGRDRRRPASGARYATPDTNLPIVVRDGRFGPYVTDGTINASLRRGDNVESITIERGRRAAWPSAGPPGRAPRGRGAKKAAAKKAGAKKVAAAKKAGAKKVGAKKVAREEGGREEGGCEEGRGEEGGGRGPRAQRVLIAHNREVADGADHRGRLIAFEGIDGCGKSTQARLRSRSLGALLTFEPGDTAARRVAAGALARFRRRALAPGRGPPDGGRPGPARRRGRRPGALGRPMGGHRPLQRFDPRLPGCGTRPRRRCPRRRGGIRDRRAPAPTSRSWSTSRSRWPGSGIATGDPDRLERLDAGFHERVAGGYRSLARSDPDTWAVVDGTGTVEEVAAAVAKVVSERLGRPEARDERARRPTGDRAVRGGGRPESRGGDPAGRGAPSGARVPVPRRERVRGPSGRRRVRGGAVVPDRVAAGNATPAGGRSPAPTPTWWWSSGPGPRSASTTRGVWPCWPSGGRSRPGARSWW